jgi:hypothetical protein
MTLYFVNSVSILRAGGVDVAGVAIMVGSRIEWLSRRPGRRNRSCITSLFTEILGIH